MRKAFALFALVFSLGTLCGPQHCLAQSRGGRLTCAAVLRSAIESLNHPDRGWAVFDVRDLIDQAEVQRVYSSMTNETGIAEVDYYQNLTTLTARRVEDVPGFVAPDGEIGVNIPLSRSMMRIIEETTRRVLSGLPPAERGRLRVREARLRRTDGTDVITPTAVHRDIGYIVINVTLMGEGSVLHVQDAKTGDSSYSFPTPVGHATVFSGRERAQELHGFFDQARAGLHAAPDSSSPRVTLSWVVGPRYR